MKPTKEQTIEVVRSALRECLLTGKFGFAIPRKAFDAYWEIFNKSLEWRLDKVYGKEKKPVVEWKEVPRPPFTSSK